MSRTNKPPPQHRKRQNGTAVCRGGPGILLTCEHGREVKCQREGIDILQHYFGLDKKTTTGAGQEEGNDAKSGVSSKEGFNPEAKKKKKTTTSSLDEELAQLRNNKSSNNNNRPDFAVYDTGCRGTVLVLCTLPDCHLIPPIEKKTSKGDEETAKDKSETKATTTAANEATEDRPKKKRRKEGSTDDHDKKKKKNGGEDATIKRPDDNDRKEERKVTRADGGWDPVPMVDLILRQASPSYVPPDMGQPLPPSSRFVTRMIPLQATCFASLEEIEATAHLLLQRFLQSKGKVVQESGGADEGTKDHKEPFTFAISIKRRNCSHLKSQTLIESLAGKVVASVAPTWKVDLKAPKVRIWVEVCRTTVGLSIFSTTDHRHCANGNFNVAEVRASSAQSDNEEEG